MNCEEEFQKQLDISPRWRMIRVRFGEWLTERNDPRAPGMAELAKRDFVAEKIEHSELRFGVTSEDRQTDTERYARCAIPRGWFDNIRRMIARQKGITDWSRGWFDIHQDVGMWDWWIQSRTRRELEDWIALGFTYRPE